MKNIFMICAILVFSVTVAHAEEQVEKQVTSQIEEQVEEQVVSQIEEHVDAESVAQVEVLPVEQVREQVVGQVEDKVEAQTIVQVKEQVEPKVPFWVKIRTRIEKMTPQKKPTVTTAVGGVRGARTEAGKELYWKGEEVKIKVSEQELAKFDDALKKVEEGEIEAARQLFENFVTDFQESELRPDAFLALREMDKAAGDN